MEFLRGRESLESDLAGFGLTLDGYARWLESISLSNSIYLYLLMLI